METENLAVNAKILASELKEITDEYQQDLPDKTKERLASYMVGSIGKAFWGINLDDVRSAYPAYDKVETLSSDLEWSNSGDVDEDWEKLLVAIDEFDKQVNSTE